MAATNQPIEALLQAGHARATELIEAHLGALMALVDELMRQGQVTPARFAALTGLALGAPEESLDPYADRLAEFQKDVARTADVPRTARALRSPVTGTRNSP